MEYTKGNFEDGTKGWKCKPLNRKQGYCTHEIIWSDDGECVTDGVYSEADAKLIAAAPELLEALEDCISAFAAGRAREKALKAIKKAKS